MPQFKANSGIVNIYDDLAELYRQYLLQNWAHTVMLNPTTALAAELAAHVTRLHEYAQMFDPKGAEFFDPSSPKWVQFHILDLKTISGSFEHHLATNKSGPTTTPAIQKRLDSIQTFLDEYQGTDPLPGNRYFSPIPVNYQNWRLQHTDFELEREEGKGVSAIVYYGHDKRTGAEVAVKEFKWDKLKGSRLKSFEREVVVLATLNHPALLKFVGAIDSPPFCIITEWMSGGTLYNDLHKSHRLDATQLTIAAIDIARGMNFLHSMSIIHRDMKSLNVLLTGDGYARICDFGFSRSLSSRDQRMTNNIGTPHWMAPEILAGNGVYDEKVDVYAYAVVLWEILTKKVPYGLMESAQIVTQVAMNDIRPPIPKTTPKPIQNFITDCWARDPESRPTFHAILGRLIAGDFLLPGADPARIEAHVKSQITDSEYSADGQETHLIPRLVGIERHMSKEDVSPALVERCWASLQVLDRESDRHLYMKCLSYFLTTVHGAEAADLLRREANGSIPQDIAARIASMLPTGNDSIDLNLVVIACRNGAAADVVIHAYQLNHVKLAMEVTARTGLHSEEMRQAVVQRCVNLLKANDSMLVLSAFRCLMAIGDAKVIPFETIRSSTLARNAAIRLVAYLAAAQMADEGVALPNDFIDWCIEKIGTVALAAQVLVAAAANLDNAKFLVTKLARLWSPSTGLQLRILFRALPHKELLPIIKLIAERMSLAESEAKEREALNVLKKKL
jgi:serine/threonine protein kinase